MFPSVENPNVKFGMSLVTGMRSELSYVIYVFTDVVFGESVDDGGVLSHEQNKAAKEISIIKKDKNLFIRLSEVINDLMIPIQVIITRKN
ncbi:hypothetical protein SDC9_107609 [bioreactor metagenome]|uniref:Uncharacterized protein n=1 Tax=bioreactor metagenome TaxID=1076179 RepID=A0A645B5P6_9ZZZZ